MNEDNMAMKDECVVICPRCNREVSCDEVLDIGEVDPDTFLCFNCCDCVNDFDKENTQ
jgi:hypothetical protein